MYEDFVADGSQTPCAMGDDVWAPGVIWLPATLLAAFFQSWRTAAQRRMREELSLNAAGLIRYLYGLPIAILLAAIWFGVHRTAPPSIDPSFVCLSLFAGLAQLIGTNLLLLSFGYRNYVVGTAFAKTEAIQGAVLSLVFLGETLHPISWLGIALGVVGVVTLSFDGASWRLRNLAQPAVLCGLGAGFGFTVASLFVKFATRHLQAADAISAALTALVVIQTGQVLMQGSYVFWRERPECAKVLNTWRQSSQVGALAALGSACWFTGFASAPVALVRTVGQVEVAFTLGFSKFYLKERAARGDAQGLLLVGVGVAMALGGYLITEGR